MTNKEPLNQEDFKKAYDSLLSAAKEGNLFVRREVLIEPFQYSTHIPIKKCKTTNR